MIVDDELVRIGSANFSRRSMGVDTECDLAVDARGDSRVRGRHSPHPRSAAGRTSRSAGGCRRARDRARRVAARAHRFERERAEHTLVRIELAAGRRGAAVGGAASRRRSGRADRVRLVGRAAGAASRRDERTQSASPLDSGHRARGRRRLDIVGARQAAGIPDRSGRCSAPSRPCRRRSGSAPARFVLANLALIPLELVAIAAGVLFGALRGGLVALLGSLVAAAIGYVGRPRDWTGRPDAVDEPAIVPIRPAARRARRGRRDRAAPRVGGERRIGSSAVRRGARSVRDLYGRHRHRLRRRSIAALSGLGALLRHTLLASVGGERR